MLTRIIDILCDCSDYFIGTPSWVTYSYIGSVIAYKIVFAAVQILMFTMAVIRMKTEEQSGLRRMYTMIWAFVAATCLYVEIVAGANNMLVMLIEANTLIYWVRGEGVNILQVIKKEWNEDFKPVIFGYGK